MNLYISTTKLLTVALLLLIAPLAMAATEPPSVIVQSFYKTLAIARSPEELNKYYSAAYAREQQALLKGMPPARMPKYMKYLRTGLPKTIKVSSEKIDGNKAIVNVEIVGSQPMDKLTTADPSMTIVLQKYAAHFLTLENGQWKLDQYSWESDKTRLPAVNPNEWQKWAYSAAKTEYSAEPVQGKFYGTPFTPTRFVLGPHRMFGGTWLEFAGAKSGDDQIAVGLLDPSGSVENKSFEIADQKMSWTKNGMFNIILTSNKFEPNSRTVAGTGVSGLKIKFGKANADGSIPGSIVLRLNQQPETSLNGTFVSTPGKVD